MESEQTTIQEVTAGPLIGKRRRLGRLCDSNGLFSMIAIDQRTSLERMLDGRCGKADVRRWIKLVKRVVTESVAPVATAVLTDPEYGYPDTLDVLPPSVGVILAVEVSGYTMVDGHERRSKLLDQFDVQAAVQAGADAVKLLIYHNPEVSDATALHQQEIVHRVGSACTEAGMPFILEIVTYGLDMSRSSDEFVRRKPEYVLDGIRAFSAPQFAVDLFKVQFPGDLKYTNEYRDRAFGEGTTIFEEKDILAICRELNLASSAPWVLLSAGVGPDEFVLNLRIAARSGASGFLCGRAVWKDVVDLLPDEHSMRRLMEQEGTRRFREMREAVSDATPWFEHPRFKQAAHVEG